MDTLRVRSENLRNTLSVVAQKKLSLWQNVKAITAGQIFESQTLAGQKRNALETHINSEVQTRLLKIDADLKDDISNVMNEAELKVIQAQIRNAVIQEVRSFITADRERLNGIKREFQDWKTLMKDGKAVKVADLKSAGSVEELQAFNGLDQQLQDIIKRNKPQANQRINELEWGNKAENMLRTQLIEMGIVDSSKLTELLENNINGDDTLINTIESKLYSRPAISNLLVDTLKQMRTDKVRGHRVLRKLTEVLPLPSDVSGTLAYLQVKGYPGQPVTTTINGKTINAIIRVKYNKNGEQYCILQDNKKGFIVVNTTSGVITYRQSATKAVQHKLDGTSTSLSLSA